jgi:anti-anti-sigma factor
MGSNAFGAGDGFGTLHLERQEDDIVCIRLVGEFDMANAASFRTEAEGAIRAHDHLILDLSDTTFVDSAVINTLFSVGKRAMAERRVVVLQLGTAPIVEKALEISGIDRAVPRADTRSGAIQAIRELERGSGEHSG